jgi:hypothetical protein
MAGSAFVLRELTDPIVTVYSAVLIVVIIMEPASNRIRPASAQYLGPDRTARHAHVSMVESAQVTIPAPAVVNSQAHSVTSQMQRTHLEC